MGGWDRFGGKGLRQARGKRRCSRLELRGLGRLGVRGWDKTKGESPGQKQGGFGTQEGELGTQGRGAWGTGDWARGTGATGNMRQTRNANSK